VTKNWNFKPNQLAQYRKTGLELIPLNVPDARDRKGRPIGKAPRYSGWRTDDFLSVDEAMSYMTKEQANVGVRLRDVDLVVAVDPRNFKEGDDPLLRLERDIGVSLRDKYPTAITGSGGYHIYMLKPADLAVRDSLEDYEGVEFKTLGRQVVAPGSVHPGDPGSGLAPGGQYHWADLDLGIPLTDRRSAPNFLLELIKRPGRIASVDAGDMSPEQIEELLEPLDPADYSDYNEWLTIMMACHHGSAGEARQEFINWSTQDSNYADQAAVIGRKWDGMHADNGGRRVSIKYLYKVLNKAGHNAVVQAVTKPDPLDDFPEPYTDVHGVDEDQLSADSVPDGDPNNDPVNAFNREGYAAVNDNGRFLIYRLVPDYEWEDPETGQQTIRMRWETYRKGDFLDIHSNRYAHKEGKKEGTFTKVFLAQEWLQSGTRTSYDAVVFDPSGRKIKGRKVLNLWTDWSVQAKKGDWSLLDQLLREGLADGDEASYEYILDWAAFMVQHPDKRAEVAIVFKGLKGTGKGTWGKVLAKLAGRHGMHISNQMHLTNHFNAHLRDCIFLFADEALWAGNKQGEGELKRLITEPTLLYEAKGKDAVTGRNHLHVMMASNEDWVVPASMEDERRFAVFNANDRFRGNRAFFDALYKQLDDGGLSALLWDLKARDISKFHPRSRVPMTKALADQKLRSLDYFDQWFYESLCRGSFGIGFGSADGTPWDGTPGQEVPFFTTDLQNAYRDYLGMAGERYKGRSSLSTAIGDRLLKRLPTLRKKRMPVPDDKVGQVEPDASGRAYAYLLPSLTECRASFEGQLGTSLPWELSGEVDDLDIVEDDDPLA
jgi:hypothetical protein